MFKAIFKAIKNKLMKLFHKSPKHKNSDRKITKAPKVTKLRKPQTEEELPQTKQPKLAQHITSNNKKVNNKKNDDNRKNKKIHNKKPNNSNKINSDKRAKSKSNSKEKNIKNIANKRKQSAKKHQTSSKVLPKFDDRDMNKIVHLSKSYLQLGSFNSKIAQIHFYKRPRLTGKKDKENDKNLETHHYFNVKVLNPCYEYKTERCSANERIYNLKPGQIVHISGVLYFDKKNHRTNLRTIGDHYMTGSTHYVKPVK